MEIHDQFHDIPNMLSSTKQPKNPIPSIALVALPPCHIVMLQSDQTKLTAYNPTLNLILPKSVTHKWSSLRNIMQTTLYLQCIQSQDSTQLQVAP